ncbi:alkene reductase [Oceanimonas sp. MB9]|uniref:alkene reductase n=1 Tax=Oceanimonas sp. MB9 TaxID=2588453 RepID=UPI003519F375
MFEPLKLGSLTLKNRIVMPPMTRSRSSQPEDVANELMATYYAQRASAGLIVSEGTQVSPMGKGYAWTPGIYSPAHIKGWRLVTDKVHEAGGVMFAQLWHVGRVSHPQNLGGEAPIAPSAIKAENVQVFVEHHGHPEFVAAATPRAMTQQDIDATIEEFRQAAHNAILAGFDGIELHAANGYLINQFIDSESNQRTDAYGGSLENRLRFLREVVSTVSDAIGPERVGVRLAPLTTLQGSVDKDPETTYVAAAKALNEAGVGYLHIAEADWEDAPHMPVSFKQAIRNAFNGVIIYAGKYTPERAQQALKSGWADMVGFGRPFIANPDLPFRIQHGLPWNPPHRDTFFGGGAEGLTDYPAYTRQAPNHAAMSST